jgi:hypothetical protein
LALRKTSKAAIVAVAIILVCGLALLLLSHPIVNGLIKPGLTKALARAFPAYSIHIRDMHYSVFGNSFGFDGIELQTVDSTLSGTVRRLDVSGVGWVHLLWGGNLTSDDFANSVIDGQETSAKLPQSQYKFRCRQFHISVPHSEINADSLECRTLTSDEKFFDVSPFRRTRIIVVARRWSVEGLDCLDFLKGDNYHCRSVQINDAVVDVLLNKDKPDGKDTAGPFMPNEILSSIKKKVNVERVCITNGQLKYSERFDRDAKPSFLTFNSMEVLAEGIANYGPQGSVFVVHAQTKFADAGLMKLDMTFPVASPNFSFRYSGSLSGMDLRPINSFLEISDQMRIKSGVLEGVTYDINVASGHANGNVSGVYRDLTIASITKNTGSENGLSNTIVSFIANKFKIRKNNVPGAMKVGRIKYDRLPDDPFFQYAWFSLRTGIRDVLGL